MLHPEKLDLNKEQKLEKDKKEAIQEIFKTQDLKQRQRQVHAFFVKFNKVEAYFLSEGLQEELNGDYPLAISHYSKCTINPQRKIPEIVTYANQRLNELRPRFQPSQHHDSQNLISSQGIAAQYPINTLLSKISALYRALETHPIPQTPMPPTLTRSTTTPQITRQQTSNTIPPMRSHQQPTSQTMLPSIAQILPQTMMTYHSPLTDEQQEIKFLYLIHIFKKETPSSLLERFLGKNLSRTRASVLAKGYVTELENKIKMQSTSTHDNAMLEISDPLYILTQSGKDFLHLPPVPLPETPIDPLKYLLNFIYINNSKASSSLIGHFIDNSGQTIISALQNGYISQKENIIRIPLVKNFGKREHSIDDPIYSLTPAGEAYLNHPTISPLKP